MYVRTFRRSLRLNGFRPTGAFGKANSDWVFIVGCPRSGTTFTANSIGNLNEFCDLGEVNRLKFGIPALYLRAREGESASVQKELRAILRRSQRISMASEFRPIEQTPESTFLIPELAAAFPQAKFVHMVRDGRDVATSLLEKGWMAREGTDDGGNPYGSYARFWVEPERAKEFSEASEATRCGWAWRRYETAAQLALAELPPERSLTIRYEEMARNPATMADRLAKFLSLPNQVDRVHQALSGVHARSIGNYRTALTTDQLRDVESEAAPLLRELGYMNG